MATGAGPTDDEFTKKDIFKSLITYIEDRIAIYRNFWNISSGFAFSIVLGFSITTFDSEKFSQTLDAFVLIVGTIIPLLMLIAYFYFLYNQEVHSTKSEITKIMLDNNGLTYTDGVKLIDEMLFDDLENPTSWKK